MMSSDSYMAAPEFGSLMYGTCILPPNSPSSAAKPLRAPGHGLYVTSRSSIVHASRTLRQYGDGSYS